MELLKTNRGIQCLFVILLSGVTFAVNVTFQVDMANKDISAEGVHIYGSMQEFINPSASVLMDEDGDSVFEITFDLNTGDVHYFSFLNGNSLQNKENTMWLASCGLADGQGGYYRTYSVANTDEILEPVCFSNCLACNEVSVTVQVDMTNEDVSGDGIYISFQEENMPSLEMANENSDEIYAITFTRTLEDTIKYRFLNGSDHEVISDDCVIENAGEFYRYHIVGQINDQVETLEPVCFEHCHNCASIALSSFSFEADVTNAVNSNGFDLGDTLLVRWGYGDDGISGENIDTLSRLDALFYPYIYSFSQDNIIINKDYGLYYQYYRPLAGESDREIYYNFDYSGYDDNLAERRYFSFDGFSEYESVIISDTETSQVDPRRRPIFINNEPIGDLLTVTYTVDLRPAYYQVLSGDILKDISPEEGISDNAIDIEVADSIFTWGVWMNGPATEPLTGESWTGWGNTLSATIEKKLHDDGIAGDEVAGDSIYTLQVTYPADAPIGQEFKFGIHGGDNEGGFGNNHIEFISVQNLIIVSSWGSIDPMFYNAWDFDTNTPELSIFNYDILAPHQFSLGKNYPNPFNPSTSFEFTIPYGTEVTLTIYDIHGSIISTVHNAYTMPGTYVAKWNGMLKASGVYFYEMSAAPYFKETGKMILIK